MSEEFKIDSDVPYTSHLGKLKYPFEDMKVGDSFLIKGNYMKVASSASWYGKRHQQKFSVRRTEEGYRCWRLK